MLTCGLIVIDTDPVQLQITVSMVGPGGIDAMLITDHLPELRKMGVENKIKHLIFDWIIGIGYICGGGGDATTSYNSPLSLPERSRELFLLFKNTIYLK